MVRSVDKPLVWLHGEVKTPPFSAAGRIEAGRLLSDLQNGALLVFPDSRPMSVIGARCHELRVGDATGAWRIVYRLDTDAVIIAAVFRKTTEKPPLAVIRTCRQRLQRYDVSRLRE